MASKNFKEYLQIVREKVSNFYNSKETPCNTELPQLFIPREHKIKMRKKDGESINNEERIRFQTEKIEWIRKNVNFPQEVKIFIILIIQRMIFLWHVKSIN